MSSLDQPAVEALLTQWESRHPGTPVRAVVDRATELGFVPTPPGGYGTADYLRLIFTEQSQRAVTLYVNGLRLTAAGSAARKVAATLPGAVVKSRDVQLPFTAANPFAALDTFRRVATGKLVAPPGPAPVRHDTGQLEFLPATSLAMASPRPSAAPASLRRRGVLALVAALVLLLVVTGAASGGLGGALVTLGLAVVLVGFAAVVVGRARWAFIATRGIGGIVVAAGVAVLAVGGATL
ncbi:MAG: Excalibur calcium-binding protein, partial [Modestobacter sp.]|nr:Excalibur calcium-binding protein [Modestobacter sp.]